MCFPFLAMLFGEAKSRVENAALTKIEIGPKKIPALIGGPKGAPAVIVIQEWWGVTDQIKVHALKVAAKGYRVLIPDLYKGKIGVDAEEAHHMMSTLDFENALAEIDACANCLKDEGSPKVGAMGFCMGGALTLGATARSSAIVAGEVFYGSNPGLFEGKMLKGKAIQAHFGAKDVMEGFSDVKAAEVLKDLLAKNDADPSSAVFIYDKVGHSFLNEDPAPYKSFEERKNTLGFPVYDQPSADLAWERLFAFFATHLQLAAVAKDL